MAFAAVLLLGAVLGPWVAQKSSPVPPIPQGANPAVKALADTLDGGMLGSATGQPAIPATEQAAPASLATAEPSIPATGEERYLQMLARMKQDGKPDPTSTPIAVVPRMDPNSTPAAAYVPAINKIPADIYPSQPIPLEIERRVTEVDEDTAKFIPVVRGTALTGRYTVLRIDRNSQGQLTALMMPLGGNSSIDAAWVSVGDATADGFVVENINASSVVLRSSNGRNIQIAL